MASRPITTTLTLPFGDADTARLVWETDPRREPPEFYQEYLRLYPINVPIYFTNSGNLGKLSDQSEVMDDVLVFDGNDEASIHYPEVQVLAIKQYGKFYDLNGNPTITSFSFDPIRNLISSSKAGYGAIEVQMRVNYTLFLFTFAGGPCPGTLQPPYTHPTVSIGSVAWGGYSGTVGSSFSASGITTTATTDDAAIRTPFHEAVVVAIDNNRGATALTRLDPPECERQEFYVNKGTEAELPRVDIREDPQFPYSVRYLETQKANSTHPMYGAAGLLVIPSDSNIQVNVNLNDATLIKRPTKKGGYQKEESLLFSGSGSLNLEFQPAGSVSYKKQGNFLNKWGSSVSVDFRFYGDKVTEVDWVNESTYRNPRQREVNPDEIVAVNSWGRVIEVFGVVDVAYSYTFDYYEIRVPYQGGSYTMRDVYLSAFRVNNGQVESGTLYLEGPSLNGIWK